MLDAYTNNIISLMKLYQYRTFDLAVSKIFISIVAVSWSFHYISCVSLVRLMDDGRAG